MRGLGRGGRPGDDGRREREGGGDAVAAEGFPELPEKGDIGRMARREMTR